MTKHLSIALLGLAAVSSYAVGAPHTPPPPRHHHHAAPAIGGVWNGSCYNETVNKSATMHLTLNPAGGNKLNGMLRLGGGQLMGSGPVNGTVSGNAITFIGPGRDERTTKFIVWTGRIVNGVFSGTYKVEPQPGYPVQVGRFSMTPAR